MRLDAYMVKEHLARGRDNAAELIDKGAVLVNGLVCRKKSTEVDGQCVTVTEKDSFVGRGAHKLKKALDVFHLSVSGLCCLDAGASTGGFTQLLLDSGAKRVYAVDVGVGQLAKLLRDNSRVVNMEKTDIRKAVLSEQPDFFSADVSFVSLAHILPFLFSLTAPEAFGVCLIKPQFEVGRAGVGKHGVVQNKTAHKQAIEAVCLSARACGFVPAGLTYSPVRGQNGNIEYLLYLKKHGISGTFSVDACIDHAWEDLA